MPSQTGSVAWHMLQRVETMSTTAAKPGAAGSALAGAARRGTAPHRPGEASLTGAAKPGAAGSALAVAAVRGPAPDSQRMTSMPAAATPQTHHGDGLPACRALKKCRITGPSASTTATISQL